jgi:hypothetical protein
MFPPLSMATSLTGGEHHRSFRRKNLHYPLEAWWSSGQDEWRWFAADVKTLRGTN